MPLAASPIATPLLAGARSATLERLAARALAMRWPRHACLLSGSQTGQQFALITRGRVKIARANGSTGRELTLWLLGPGDGFDVVSLLDGQPHDVAAWALDEVQGYLLPLPVMRQAIDRDETLRHALHRYAAQQLRSLSQLAADLALHDTGTRLARLLLRYLAPPAPERTPSASIHGLPHEELASMIGTVRVVVNRLLGRLRRERIVQTAKGELHIDDLQALAAWADQAEASGHNRRIALRARA